MRMPPPGPPARKARRGFSVFELVVGVFVVFALLLGVLILVTSEGGGSQKDFSVSPYRAMYAGYINNRLKEWTNALLSYQEMHGYLPGDFPDPGYINSKGQAIGNADGRVERENEENIKFFSDLYHSGLSSDPRIRVRSHLLDFFWFDPARNATRGEAGNYFVLPGTNRDEALALDHNYDDGDKTAGRVLYFDNPAGTVDVFVLFVPF